MFRVFKFEMGFTCGWTYSITVDSVCTSKKWKKIRYDEKTYISHVPKKILLQEVV